MKADFAYDTEADVCRCPAGGAQKYRYTINKGGLVVRRYWTNVCLVCPVKARYSQLTQLHCRSTNYPAPVKFI